MQDCIVVERRIEQDQVEPYRNHDHESNADENRFLVFMKSIEQGFLEQAAVVFRLLEKESFLQKAAEK